MLKNSAIWVAKGAQEDYLLPALANRHGLIAGATGTGKTTTLRVLAEGFSDMGVPVFLADIKGDLGGLAVSGADNPKLQERRQKLGVGADFAFKAYPVRFWDIFGERGHPVRATVTEMGPVLLARMLDLNDTQEGVLNIVFRVADENGLLLLDMKDLRSMLQYTAEHAKELTTKYGNVSAQSIGAIQRALLVLEQQGADLFFGEPALQLADWFQTSFDGKGVINILDSVRLFQSPALYSTFLLWLMSEVYEQLPEVGDLEKPRLVFFFDEAHLLFNDIPKALLQKIDQLVRLIRSKGVGVYFITQNPMDLPETVLAQLGNRVQHGLRAFTSAEQKRVRAAAQTFRQNPAFDTEKALLELGTGEVVLSFLDQKGVPGIADRAMVLPPQSQMAPIDDATRQSVINTSPFGMKYATAMDRESAYEMLQSKYALEQQQKVAEAERVAAEKKQKEYEKEQARLARQRPQKTIVDTVAGTVVNTIGREVGRSFVRGILGSLRRR